MSVAHPFSLFLYFSHLFFYIAKLAVTIPAIMLRSNTSKVRSTIPATLINTLLHIFFVSQSPAYYVDNFKSLYNGPKPGLPHRHSYHAPKTLKSGRILQKFFAYCIFCIAKSRLQSTHACPLPQSHIPSINLAFLGKSSEQWGLADVMDG